MRWVSIKYKNIRGKGKWKMGNREWKMEERKRGSHIGKWIEE